jgi:NAD(P)-dependent dehydrogenase (short-subunit alcohol dehydrogenase family)
MALLPDKVVLVSGGTQGVGAGVVRAAAREGAAVAFTGRRPDKQQCRPVVVVTKLSWWPGSRVASSLPHNTRTDAGMW